MKLWLLKPINEDAPGGPWDPWYDKAFGFVVRAETEDAARHLIGDYAVSGSGDEGIEAWLDPELSNCIELLPEGEEEIIMRDFARA